MDHMLVRILDRLNEFVVIYTTEDPAADADEPSSEDGVLGVYQSLQWVGHSSRTLDPHFRLANGGFLRMPVDQLILLFASIASMPPCAKALTAILQRRDASNAVELMLVCVVERAYTNFLSKDHGSKQLDVIPPILYNDLLALLCHHRTSDDPRSHAVTESVRASFARMLGLVVGSASTKWPSIDMDGNVFFDADGGKLDSLMRACRNLINARGLLASECDR